MTKTHTERYTALILDDTPGDAVVLKQMLTSSDQAEISASIHHSSQGVFPASATAYDWVFIADNYASSDPAQLVGLAQARYPQAQIILCCDENVSSQTLLTAARCGLAQIVEKDALSRSLLNNTVQQLLAAPAPQQGTPALTHPISQAALALEQTAKPAINAKTHHDSHSGAALRPLTQRPATQKTEQQQNSEYSPEQERRVEGPVWNELSTGIIALEHNGSNWQIRSINNAAAERHNLEPAALIGTELGTEIGTEIAAAPFNYQNLKLAEQLNNIAPQEQLRFTDVLQIDADGEASWYNITATRYSQQGMLLELHSSTHHSAAEESSTEEQQVIWRHIVSSYPDLCALVDEDGSIIELVSGEWQTVQNNTEALKGQTLSSLICEEQRQNCREMLSKALNTGKPQQTVFKLEQSDGPMWLHSSLSLLRTPAATQRTALLVASNVTEMFEQQQATKAELETMKEFTRRVPFALAIKDSDGRFERANPYFLDLFSVRNDDVIGKTEADLFPEHLSAHLAELERRMQTSNDVVEANVQIDPDDWAECRFVKLPLHNEVDNNLASCLLVFPPRGENQINTGLKPSKRAIDAAVDAAAKKKSPRLKTTKQ